MTNNAPLEFFESHDQQLLAEYVELRRRVFHVHYPTLPEDFGRRDEIDDISGIVLCRRDFVLVGGARLTVSRPEAPRELPLERNGLSIREDEDLRKLKLNAQPYAEISRMAIAPHSRTLAISLGLSRKLCSLAGSLGIDVILSICPDGAARLNQINSAKLGVTFHNVRKIQTEFGMDMWLCVFAGILNHYSRESAA